jgi:hypothetical protein
LTPQALDALFGFLQRRQLDKMSSHADGRIPDMSHPETDLTYLYPLYCDYVQHVNRSAGLRGGWLADIAVLSQPDFLAIWGALPESRRDFWQRRFEAGHDEVANLERRKLVAAFTSNDLHHTGINAARAA